VYHGGITMRLRIGRTLSRVNRWAGLLGLILGVVLALWTVRRGEELVARTGGFKGPAVALGIGDCRFSSDEESIVVIGTQFAADEAAIVRLILTVTNTGSAAGRSVVVTSNSLIAKGFLDRVKELCWTKDNPAETVINVTASHAVRGDRLFSTFAASVLSPSGTMQISVPLTFDFRTITQGAATDQRVCALTDESHVSVYIQQETEPARKFEIHAIACQANTLDDLKTAVAANLNELQRFKRGHAGSVSRWMPSSMQRTELIYGELVRHTEDATDNDLAASGCIPFPLVD
jgi:hypothetical protein